MSLRKALTEIEESRISLIVEQKAMMKQFEETMNQLTDAFEQTEEYIGKLTDFHNQLSDTINDMNKKIATIDFIEDTIKKYIPVKPFISKYTDEQGNIICTCPSCEEQFIEMGIKRCEHCNQEFNWE